MRNRANKQKMKTFIRRVEEAVASGAGDEAQTALQEAIPVIAKTASKGTIPKKTASRKISRLSKKVNKLQAAA